MVIWLRVYNKIPDWLVAAAVGQGRAGRQKEEKEGYGMQKRKLCRS